MPSMDRRDVLFLYRQMLLIRRFEEKSAEMYALAKIAGFLHLYIGEEAIAVGAIAALRPEYRSCIMLRHVEGRSYEEIAATLDLPLGTVKTYIHRARHQLREALGGERE